MIAAATSATTATVPEDAVVTVVTIVWNDLEGLKLTADSVLAQDYPHIEHLIVDGASTDGAVDWLNDPANQPPGRRFVSEPDDGIYNAMNKGLGLATGQFVLFLNARDLFSRPDALSKLVATARDANAHWAFGYVTVVDENGEQVRPVRIGEYTFERQFWQKERLAHQAVLGPRELLLELGGFDESFKIVSDWDLSLRLAHKHKPAQLKEVVVHYDNTGLSTQHWAKASWETRLARDNVSEKGPVGFVWRRMRLMAVISKFWLRGKGKAVAKRLLPEEKFKSVILRRT